MKRNFILVCVSALVLALGLSASAGAGVSADASAKPAKKGKSCKKKGGKGKAGKSAAATAQAKKKGKSKSCKGKGKSKGTDKATPTPAPIPAPAPVPPAAAPLSDGTYGDPTKLLELKVSGGATTAVLKYVPPGNCVAINYTSQPVALTKNGDTWTASETRAFSIVGEPATVKWDLTVKDPGLTYALNLTMESNSMIGLCKWEGHPTGTLSKIG